MPRLIGVTAALIYIVQLALMDRDPGQVNLIKKWDSEHAPRVREKAIEEHMKGFGILIT